MNLLALIERHRNDPNPHPNQRVTLTDAQLAYVVEHIAELIPDLPDIPEASDSMPKATTFGVDGSPGTLDEYARGDHRHPLALPAALTSLASLNQNGWVRKDGDTFSARDGVSLTVDVLVAHDQKTGQQRFHRLTFDRGIMAASQLGPWRPYSESLAALAGPTTPSAGNPPPTGSHLYRHVSNSLTYAADTDNIALSPRFLSPLVCSSAVSANVTVQPNAGGTWFGTVIPIQLVNNGAAPQPFVVQVRDAAGIPSGHKVNIGIGNIPEAETQWMADLPQAWNSTDEVQPDGGTLTVWLFLGLGTTAAANREPDQAAYNLQVDVWLV